MRQRGTAQGQVTGVSEGERLVERVRDALSPKGPIREVAMFGGLSFMLDEKMVVSVGGNGDLLVRADPDRSDELLAKGGARQAEMGTGRSMGKSWITVDRSAVAADEALDFWIDVAVAFNGKAISAGGSGRKRRKS